MRKRKVLSKNEFRIDLNKKHQGKNRKPHPAYISAKCGNKVKANNITHSKYTRGRKNLSLSENPNLNSKDKRQTHITPPYWQNSNMFSKKLNNFKFSNRARRKISRYNRKFK